MRASHPFSHFKIVLSRIPQLLSSRQKVHHLSPLSVSGSLILQGAVAFGESGFVVSTMAKIFKYISNIFVVKEREMEIGLPTDVKHVAHIGWDGPSDSAPSWMNEFKNEPDFSTLGRNNNSNRRDSTSSMATSSIWASQEFETSMGRQPSNNSIDHLPNDSTNAPKKTKRKKVKSSSSSSSSSRSSRQMKTSKAAYTNMEPTPNLLV